MTFCTPTSGITQNTYSLFAVNIFSIEIYKKNWSSRLHYSN